MTLPPVITRSAALQYPGTHRSQPHSRAWCGVQVPHYLPRRPPGTFLAISLKFYTPSSPQDLLLVLPSPGYESRAFSFSHCSGVRHLGVQAWMAAISCFRAALTRRCRASSVFFSNSGDTITAVNACPHPPDMSWMDTCVVCSDPCSFAVSDSGVMIESSAAVAGVGCASDGVDIVVVGIGMAEGERARRLVLKFFCWWWVIRARLGTVDIDVDVDEDANVGFDAMRRASCDAAPRKREEGMPVERWVVRRIRRWLRANVD